MSIGVLVAVGAAAYEPDLLAGLRHERVHVVRRCVDLADLLAVAASRQAEVALVTELLPGLDAESVAWLERAGVAVVGVVATAGEGIDGSAEGPGLGRLGVEVVVAADDP